MEVFALDKLEFPTTVADEIRHAMVDSAEISEMVEGILMMSHKEIIEKRILLSDIRIEVHAIKEVQAPPSPDSPAM